MFGLKSIETYQPVSMHAEMHAIFNVTGMSPSFKKQVQGMERRVPRATVGTPPAPPEHRTKGPQIPKGSAGSERCLSGPRRVSVAGSESTALIERREVVDEARSLVRRTTLGFLQFPDGIDWDGNDVRVCVAIAAKGNEHMAVLSGLAQILMEPEQAEALRTSSNVDEVLELLSSIGEEDE